MIDSAILMMLGVQFLYRLPLLALWTAGLVIAILRWPRHPRISLFATIACGVQILASLAGLAASTLPMVLRGQESSVATISSVSAITSAAITLLSLAAWVAVLLAIFGDRPAPAAAPAGPSAASRSRMS